MISRTSNGSKWADTGNSATPPLKRQMKRGHCPPPCIRGERVSILSPERVAALQGDFFGTVDLSTQPDARRSSKDRHAARGFLWGSPWYRRYRRCRGHRGISGEIAGISDSWARAALVVMRPGPDFRRFRFHLQAPSRSVEVRELRGQCAAHSELNAAFVDERNHVRVFPEVAEFGPDVSKVDVDGGGPDLPTRQQGLDPFHPVQRIDADVIPPSSHHTSADGGPGDWLFGRVAPG